LHTRNADFQVSNLGTPLMLTHNGYFSKVRLIVRNIHNRKIIKTTSFLFIQKNTVSVAKFNHIAMR